MSGLFLLGGLAGLAFLNGLGGDELVFHENASLSEKGGRVAQAALGERRETKKAFISEITPKTPLFPQNGSVV